MSQMYSIDRDRWAKLTIFEQMGNIYSEVGRSFNAKQRHDNELYRQAVARAIDLFDATTTTLIAQRSPKAKEVLRAKEEFLRVCETMHTNEVQRLDRYFMQFAIAARLHL